MALHPWWWAKEISLWVPTILQKKKKKIEQTIPFTLITRLFFCLFEQKTKQISILFKIFFPLFYLFIIIFSFIFISWRLITLQYFSGFCHTLTWISHGFTCVPHPDPPSCLPLHPIPLGLPGGWFRHSKCTWLNFLNEQYTSKFNSWSCIIQLGRSLNMHISKRSFSVIRL